MKYRTLLLAAASAAVLLLTAGCAKYPAGGGTSTGPQLVISMTMNAPINPNYYYFVVFDVSNDRTGGNGPVPVIAPPWGNGWVANKLNPSTTTTNPGATSYVEYTAAQGYLLYNFTDSSLQTHSSPVAPVQSVDPAGGNTLEFTVLLSQLATAKIPASQISYIQANFITTNVLPANPNDTSVVKYFDALGDANSGQLNDYITISTLQAAIVNNQTDDIEPTGDVSQTNNSGGYTNVNEPDLDITNWSIQIVR